MKAKRVLLDTFTGKFFMVGPGGYELRLSPGSEVYDTVDSKAGHMMLPCSQFGDASRQQNNQESQTFLVGDYFAPQDPSEESRAALQRPPGCDATFDTTTTTNYSKPPPGAAPLANRRRRERNFATTAGHDASS